MDNELVDLLKLALYCLNSTRRFRVNGLPDGMEDSYAVAAKIDTFLRQMP